MICTLLSAYFVNKSSCVFFTGAASDVMVQNRRMDAWLRHELDTRRIPYTITINDVTE